MQKDKMNNSLRFTKRIALVDIKLYLALLIYIMLTLVLSGCDQKSNQNEASISNDTLSVPLPNALKAMVLDATNLVVDVVVDAGTPQACTNLTVDPAAGTYSCTITLSGGAHTLSISRGL